MTRRASARAEDALRAATARLRAGLGLRPPARPTSRPRMTRRASARAEDALRAATARLRAGLGLRPREARPSRPDL